MLLAARPMLVSRLVVKRLVSGFEGCSGLRAAAHVIHVPVRV